MDDGRKGSGRCRCDVVGHAPLLLEQSYNVSQFTNSHVIADGYKALLYMLLSKQEFEKASDIFKCFTEDISKASKVHYADWLLSIIIINKNYFKCVRRLREPHKANHTTSCKAPGFLIGD
jgi:hypothetical protein